MVFSVGFGLKRSFDVPVKCGQHGGGCEQFKHGFMPPWLWLTAISKLVHAQVNLSARQNVANAGFKGAADFFAAGLMQVTSYF
jgi:hypothetical protein